MSFFRDLGLMLLAYVCTGVIGFCEGTNALPNAPFREPRLRSAVLLTNLPGSTLHGFPSAPPLATNLAKPGLYKTVPYTCLVLVPDGALDKGALVVPGEAPEIPLIQPKLEFVPWPGAKK